MERKRQEELARQRLEARRNKKKTNSAKDMKIDVPDDPEDLAGMQEAVIKELERKQMVEREVFYQVGY